MSGNPWDAEIVVDEATVHHLITSQFPELPIDRLRLLAEGWDNGVWAVNDEWAFRFPRVSGAVAFLVTEMAVLPRLGPMLPLPIPVPVFVGRPDERYPWPFAGARLIPGRELVQSGLSEDERAPAARQLGGFLRRLHDRSLITGVESLLPRRPEHSDAARRMARDKVRLDELARLGVWHPPAGVHDLMEQAAAVGPSRELVVAHGDLHVRHLLVDEVGEATGVIDWGEVSLCHPSTDLHIAWSGFSGPAREAFLSAYGDVPDEWRLRARVSALFYSVALALHAHRLNQEHILREAVAGMNRSLDADP